MTNIREQELRDIVKKHDIVLQAGTYGPPETIYITRDADDFAKLMSMEKDIVAEIKAMLLADNGWI